MRNRLFGGHPIRANGQLTCLPCSLQRFFGCLSGIGTDDLQPTTSHRTIATTLSAAGVGSDNSPARVMSSMECSVMYFE